MKLIIRKPLVTEKNSIHSAGGVYVFEVDAGATKVEIRNAVQKQFNVKVSAVNTMVGRGSARRSKFGVTRGSKFKKALVRLQQGEKIALFEGA